jgi:hypothetical protein
MKTGNVILDKSFGFAIKIIEFAEKLENRHKFVIAKQILRSGTSIGANHKVQKVKRISFINLKGCCCANFKIIIRILITY